MNKCLHQPIISSSYKRFSGLACETGVEMAMVCFQNGVLFGFGL
jgi:hypothetical protein